MGKKVMRPNNAVHTNNGEMLSGQPLGGLAVLDEASEEIVLRPATGRVIKPYRWLWKDVIHEGAFHVFTGESGISKTMLLMNIAATVTLNGKFPNCNENCSGGNVAYLSSEDDWELTLLERFDALGGDRDKLLEVPAFKRNGRLINLHNDLDRLEKVIESNRARLLIIDPVISFVDSAFKNDDVVSVSGLIERIRGMARRTKCAVIALVHLNKNDAVRAKSRINGSAAWEQRSRIVLGARKHSDHGFMFGKLKANIATMKGVYRYEQKTTWIDGKEVRYVDWVEEEDSYWQTQKFDSYMGTGTDSAPVRTKTQLVEEDLEDTLSGSQWHDSRPLIDQLARKHDVHIKTVRRAADSLGVKKKRKNVKGEAGSSGVEWSLPRH